MLAQITQPGFWSTMSDLALVASLAGNVALVLSLRKHKEVRRIEPQPFEVKVLQEMAREKDCLERHNANREQIHKLQEQRSDDERKATISRKTVYERINQVESGMRSHVDDVRRELSMEIRDMPAQVVALLKNTGAIGK